METTGYRKDEHTRATPKKAGTLAVEYRPHQWPETIYSAQTTQSHPHHQCQGLCRMYYTTFRSIDSRSQVEMEKWRVI